MDESPVDRKTLAAALLGCAPEELLGFRDEGLSGVVLIAPDGRKLRYPEELLRRAQAWFVAEPSGQPPLPSREAGRGDRSDVESRPPKKRRPKKEARP